MSECGCWSRELSTDGFAEADGGLFGEGKGQLGWRGMTVWECELGDRDKMLRRIEEFLREWGD